MALVVEDGTAKSNAESYTDFAFATAYHQARGNSAWTTDQTEGEAALRQATGYMLGAYRARWAGWRKTDTQALDWPRVNVPRRDGPGGYRDFMSFYDFSTVPTEVQQACAELALRALAGDLNADLTSRVKRRTIGPITTEFDTASPEEKRFPAAEALLRPLFGGGGLGMRIRRA